MAAGGEVFGLEHGDLVVRAQFEGALDGEGEAGDAECVVGLGLDKRGETLLQIMGLHKGRGGVKAAGGVALPAVLLHPLHGVVDDCACGGIVVGEFARAREWDACAVLLGDGGDFGVIGGDADLGKAA